MKDPIYLMIHHTAVSYEKNANQFRANNEYHKAKWNFKSSLGYYLGYNYEIAANGKVQQARADGETTAACYQNNMNDGRTIHIALDGNFDIEKPKPAQIYALRDLMQRLVKEYNIKRKNIIFHKDFSPKTCPGNNVEIEFIRSLAFPDQGIKEETKTKLQTKIILALQDIIALVRKL